MKVFVTGGVKQHPAIRKAVFDALDELARSFPITEVHHGGSPGVDGYGEQWAEAAGVTTVIHPPAKPGEMPTRQDRKARAFRIYTEHKPDLVLVFHGRSWVRDMAIWAARCGLPVVRLDKPAPVAAS